MQQTPISVLYFTSASARGGTEEHMLTLMRGLDRSIFRPRIACGDTLATLLAPDLPPDVTLARVNLRRPRDFGGALGLMRVLRRLRVEILHSHLFYSSFFASPLGWLAGVPVIVETPHVREEWRRGWLKSKYVLDRLAGHFVDYYIAVSEANARYLRETKKLPHEKIVVIHNGCDLGKFDPSRPAPPGMKAKLGFGANDRVLVSIGRLEPQKGHRILLEALVAVRQEFPAVRLVCVGEGALRSELESLALGRGLHDAVRFVGYQNNVGDWLSLGDLTVLSSFYEGLPLVAIESLAAGRPLVATAVDGTPEVVLDRKTGLTVPSGDPARLAGAICELLRDPALRQRMGLEGRRWVLENFDEKEQVRKTQELYLRAWEAAQRSAKDVAPVANVAAKESAARSAGNGHQ